MKAATGETRKCFRLSEGFLVRMTSMECLLCFEDESLQQVRVSWAEPDVFGFDDEAPFFRVRADGEVEPMPFRSDLWSILENGMGAVLANNVPSETIIINFGSGAVKATSMVFIDENCSRLIQTLRGEEFGRDDCCSSCEGCAPEMFDEVIVTKTRDTDEINKMPFALKRCRDIIFDTIEMVMHFSLRPTKRRKAGSAGASDVRLEEPMSSFMTSEGHVQEFSLGADEVVDRGGVSGENNLDMMENFPTQVPSRKWTLGEIKWFATHWMYNVSGSPDRESASVANEGGDVAATTFSRKWSPQEMEWFETHWNYDKGKVTGGDRSPLMSPDGSTVGLARDKIKTG